MTPTIFDREVSLPVPVEEAFSWHERPGALDRLIPPWENVQIASRAEGVSTGARVELRNRLGPFRLRWIARHYDYVKNRQFRDWQVRGPFAHWDHLHSFRAEGPQSSVMRDSVEYRIPGGLLGWLLGGRFIRDRVERMFAFRHETTTGDLAAHARFKSQGASHIGVTGAGGLVGRQLAPFLTTGGHTVTRLVRRSALAGQAVWDPAAAEFDAGRLEGIDAVVHLAGENIAARRWNVIQKQRIRDSRVQGTRRLCEELARLKTPPRTLVSASAIGLYGNRGDELLDESSGVGRGFLAEVARDWEAATKPAIDAGIRVVQLRFAMILSPRGGALAKMLLPFQLGAGGVIGNGKQFWSWISIDDAVGVIYHAIMNESLSGPVNVAAPAPVTNREFTLTLGRVLSRPTLLPMPAFAARLALGEMADQLLLSSNRVTPDQLVESGYEFRHADLEHALRFLLGR